MTTERLAPLVLRLDAGANAALALAIGTAAPLLVEAGGLEASWPLGALAVLLAGNGVACWRAAARPTPAALVALAGVDLVFAAVIGGLALADPTAADVWLRWGAAGMADVVAVVGLAKLWWARALRPAVASPPS